MPCVLVYHNYCALSLKKYFPFQMYHSAIKSKVLDKITFVQNGIDESRQLATLAIDPINNGGSGVMTNTNSGEAEKLKEG